MCSWACSPHPPHPDAAPGAFAPASCHARALTHRQGAGRHVGPGPTVCGVVPTLYRALHLGQTVAPVRHMAPQTGDIMSAVLPKTGVECALQHGLTVGLLHKDAIGRGGPREQHPDHGTGRQPGQGAPTPGQPFKQPGPLGGNLKKGPARHFRQKIGNSQRRRRRDHRQARHQFRMQGGNAHRAMDPMKSPIRCAPPFAWGPNPDSRAAESGSAAVSGAKLSQSNAATCAAGRACEGKNVSAGAPGMP